MCEVTNPVVVVRAAACLRACVPACSRAAPAAVWGNVRANAVERVAAWYDAQGARAETAVAETEAATTSEAAVSAHGESPTPAASSWTARLSSWLAGVAA